MYKPITDCRLCYETEFSDIIDLGVHALTGVFPKSALEDIPAGPLHLIKCINCGLVQLAHNYELGLLYGDTYGYRSGLNMSMVRHLRRKVSQVMDLVPLQAGDLVIDIGSNDATLLNSYPIAKLRKIGVDPSGAKFSKYYRQGVELIPEFFSANAVLSSTGGRRAKVVTSIAMFYDLERPRAFIEEILKVLDDDGIWLFEQSYLPAMLRACSYDTICHEHLEYYALEQIDHLLRRTGLKIVAVEENDANGGSFAVMAARRSARYPEAQDAAQALLGREKEARLNTMRPFDDFKEAIVRHREELQILLQQIHDRGETVFGYGASTKGNVLLQYCGIDQKLLPLIAEVNEDKFGAFTPGTRIPIVSEQEARSKAPDYFLVLPWHFREGIVEKERSFLEGGGRLIFPLPVLEIVSARGIDAAAKRAVAYQQD